MENLIKQILISFFILKTASAQNINYIDLTQIINQTKTNEQTLALIILSPRMVYSFLEWENMKKSAQNAGYKIVPARDYRVNNREWENAVKILKLKELEKIKIIKKEDAIKLKMLNHAPTTVIIKCGHIHPWTILGVMPERYWLKLIAQREKELIEKCEK